ncbi:hypothetical protein MY494_05305 [Synechococcus sp. A10-1-5-1]|uniref:type IV pilus modification PilV family protein n=1 Tax=Synechococcus sp. A10-1-5-1 TaxID=2936507 RepID=UPI002001589C|nr:hypothetical protein [Synechococcus sp. A10-1-5-1]UPM51177.1 hypothetical protein MY494_05305 [Synechococcus sp. A10-1-5-1]
MTSRQRKQGNEGISLPEVLIASFILILVVLNSIRMTTSALSGMGRSKSRSLVDVAIAERIETLRKQSFDFLCTQGCSNDELTQALKYDLTTLKPLCAEKNLGEAFLSNLPPTDKPESFSVASIPPVTVEVTYTAEQNRLHVSYAAATNPDMVVSTTLVPHAHGWCP